MRNWINLVETLGELYSFDGDDELGVGYWFNPRTGKHYTIAWDAAHGNDLYTDHGDVVADHPEWFGLTKEFVSEAGDYDTLRYGAVANGWVRIGFNPTYGLRMDARNSADAAKAMRWFASNHEEVKQVTIDLVSNENVTSYLVSGADVADYEAKGRLEPAWKFNY